MTKKNQQTVKDIEEHYKPKKFQELNDNEIYEYISDHLDKETSNKCLNAIKEFRRELSDEEKKDATDPLKTFRRVYLWSSLSKVEDNDTSQSNNEQSKLWKDGTEATKAAEHIHFLLKIDETGKIKNIILEIAKKERNFRDLFFKDEKIVIDVVKWEYETLVKTNQDTTNFKRILLGYITNETIPIETIPNKTITNETITIEAFTIKTTTNETIAIETITNKTVVNKTINKETITNKTITNNTITNKTITIETITIETFPKKTFPKKTFPKKTFPKKTFPNDITNGTISYPEFVFALEYYVICCNAENANYRDDLIKAINEYPDSDVLEIDEIKKRCDEIPDNKIRYWLCRTISSNEDDANVVKGFLESFPSSGEDGRLLCTTTIKQRLWNIIMSESAVPDVVSDGDDDILMSLQDLECFMDSFAKKTAVTLLLPKKEEILNITDNNTSQQSAYNSLNWVTSDSPDSSQSAKAILYRGQNCNCYVVLMSPDKVKCGFATLTPVIKILSE